MRGKDDCNRPIWHEVHIFIGITALFRCPQPLEVVREELHRIIDYLQGVAEGTASEEQKGMPKLT